MQPKLIFLFFLFRVLPSFGQPTQDILYPIRENGLWGYIDSTGTVVISPRFLNAGDFSDDLAPVRIGGRYGYVAPNGEIKISPQFDYAESFVDGLGKVWLEGKPFFTDKEGRLTFSPNSYKEIKGFEKGLHRGIVTTASGNVGLIDPHGKFILDTIFMEMTAWGTDRFIGVYKDSTILVSKSNSRFPFEVNEVAVFNFEGQILVPPGRYRWIKPNSPFEAEVTLLVDTNVNPPLRRIDRNGNFFQLFPDRHFNYTDSSSPLWNEGRVKVDIFSKPINEYYRNGSTREKPLPGWLCTDGRLIIPDSTAESVTSFFEGRAFAWYGLYSKYYVLFDRNGERVSNRVFSQVLTFPNDQYFECGFVNGKAVVVSDSGFVEIIDTMGRTLKRIPRGIGNSQIYDLGSSWAYTGIGCWGFWAPQSNSPVAKTISYLDHDFGIRDGLIRALDQERLLVYLNTKGEVVWRQHSTATKRRKMCTDCQLRGLYCSWQQVQEPERYPIDSFSLVLRPDDSTTYSGEFEAIKCYLVNRTQDTLCSWSIQPNLQAKDALGNWHSLMYQPQIFCESGRSMQCLAPNKCIEYSVPVFEGVSATMLRAVIWGTSNHGQSYIYIVSNAIPAFINPGQLWRIPDQDNHTGVIKPYVKPFYLR